MPIPILSQVIAQVEDAGWQWGSRFEPNVYAEVCQGAPNDVTLALARANRCNIATAYVWKSTSFGFYQIMGFNLYSAAIGYDKSIGEFWASADDQRAVVDRLLDSIGFPDGSADWIMRDDGRADLFAKLYNGDARTYVPRLRAAYTSLAA